MTSDEILQAAKEAGLLHKEAQTASQIVFDFAAIEAMIAKAGEVMRWRCKAMLRYQGGANIDLVRALPGVSMEDLK